MPVTCLQTQKWNACDISNLSALDLHLALDKSIQRACFYLVGNIILN